MKWIKSIVFSLLASSAFAGTHVVQGDIVTFSSLTVNGGILLNGTCSGSGCGAGGSSSLGVNYAGVSVTSPTAQINFVGPGVSLVANGSTATVTISSWSGNGSGAGYNVEPATVAFQLNQGFTASTGTIGSVNAGAISTLTPSRFRFRTQGIEYIENKNSDASDASGVFTVMSSTGTSNPFYLTRRSSGTVASPSAAQQGMSLGRFGSGGYGASTWNSSSTGYQEFLAEENFTDSSQATGFSIRTTSSTAITATEKIYVSGAGALTVKGTSTTFVNAVGMSSATVSSVTVNSQFTLPALSHPVLTGTGQVAYDNDVSSQTPVIWDQAMAATVTVPRVIFSTFMTNPQDIIYASNTVTNTTTTFNQSFTFPANYWTVGKRVQLVYSVQYIATVTIPNFQLALRFQKSGPTNAYLAYPIPGTPTATSSFTSNTLIYNLECVATGASGAINATVLATGANYVPSRSIVSLPVTFDTTAAQTVQLGLSYSGTNNSNAVQVLDMFATAMN